MAADWFLKAAKKNNATAQYNLAGAYAMGKGVTQNIREGLRWLQKAADQKHPDAFLTLGVVYSSGEFMPPDLSKAYAYLEVAMDLGKEQALMAVPQVWQAMSESQQEHATVLGKELHERYGVINPRENFDWSQIETDEKAIQIKRKSAKINGTEKEATGSSSRNDKKTRS
jgi:TPR repeat protein